MNAELERRWQLERWIAVIRLIAVSWALVEIVLVTDFSSERYETAAWIMTGVLAAGALLFLLVSRLAVPRGYQRAVCFAGLLFDTAVIWSYALVFTLDSGAPTIRALLFFPVLEAALRYGLLGGVLLPVAQIPVLVAIEWWRSDHFEPSEFRFQSVIVPFGLQLAVGAVVGWLVKRLEQETSVAHDRAAEAEVLRDQLGHRVDLLDATNRCARALGSSLEIEEAFGAFIRELRGAIRFDRTAIVLVDDGSARVIAAAGAAAETVFPPGTQRPVAGSVLDEVTNRGQTVYREDMVDVRYPEEEDFVELGLRCRLAAPLFVGPRSVGMISLVRKEPRSFTTDEIEFVSLLGRFLGGTVQNIRAYEAERATVEELRRLSALRADFVALVSHELKSPITAVIGSAKTLQDRWRELTPEQRDSFLTLIDHETNRLADLVTDVLDMSRIESGQFSYSFGDVDLGELVQQSAAAAASAQDEVKVTPLVHRPLPLVRGDRDRLRQVLGNLLDNAVKYSPAGGEVEVEALAENGRISVEVRDRGPGIASEHYALIFEKFGRVRGEHAKPGTGLGLFIARSIAEAHGGSLEVRPREGEGTAFALELPVERL
ncbi:MAG: GAF domain-containing protein [Actinobacteria bacterium]|nr:MAG: GAF domain-containing protein [Actinomycetota bacterium]